MKLEYTMTMATYKAANKLHRRLRISRRILAWLGPILLFLSLAGFVASSLSNHNELAADCIALVAGATVIVVGVPISKAINMRRCFRQLFPPKRASPASCLEINDGLIVSSVPGVSEGKIFWPGIHGFAQDEIVTMIYTAPNRFIFFPTPVLSPEQRIELNGMIDHHEISRKP